jgi:hypothetical protein
VRYEVRVTNRAGRFEIERDEPLAVGDRISAGSMVYKVVRLLPGSGGFDAVVEVEWVMGPAQGLGRAP